MDIDLLNLNIKDNMTKISLAFGETKSLIDLNNEDKGSGLTWDEANGTWDEMDNQWSNPKNSLSREAKSKISLVNDSK